MSVEIEKKNSFLGEDLQKLFLCFFVNKENRFWNVKGVNFYLHFLCHYLQATDWPALLYRYSYISTCCFSMFLSYSCPFCTSMWTEVAWDTFEMCCSISDGTASIRVRAGTWCIHTQCVPRVSFPTSLQQSAPPSLLSPVLTLLHLFPITPLYRRPCFPSFIFQIALFFSDITSVLPCVFVPSLV